jgi:Na+/phosphate symporter
LPDPSENNSEALSLPSGISPSGISPSGSISDWLRAASVRQLLGVSYRFGMFAISLGFFIFALILLKEGARQLGPLVRNVLDVNNSINALGFGWLFAYAVMSGSPVATITLTLLDVQTLTRPEAFAMITGSRLGASFIVLFIGFIYWLRGGERKASMSTGLLSLLVTQSTYLPALALGSYILKWGWLDSWQVASAVQFTSFIDAIFDPVITLLIAWVPRWVIFGLGFAVLMVSFSLMDRALPKVHLEESRFRGMARILYRPIFTFLLGAAITTLTMSVSLSLSILVPLSMRGYVRRENVIPYVMGANITTFIDTLMAAVLLGNPAAFSVVLVSMLTIAVISLVIILFFFRSYERLILGVANRLLSHRKWLAAYMFVIFAVPILLMFF